MKNAFFTSILLFFSCIAFCQENAVQAFNLKKGLYREYPEFRNNNPSFTDTVFTDNSNTTGDMFFGTGKIKLKTLSSEKKVRYIKGDIWGFCDTKNVFIRYAKDYHLLLNIGAYSVFSMDVKTYKPGIQYFSGMYIPKHSYSYKLLYALEFKTGKIYRLNEINMSMYILVHDNDLLQRYEKEKDKGNNEIMLNYIEEFNKKEPIIFNPL